MKSSGHQSSLVSSFRAGRRCAAALTSPSALQLLAGRRVLTNARRRAPLSRAFASRFEERAPHRASPTCEDSVTLGRGRRTSVRNFTFDVSAETLTPRFLVACQPSRIQLSVFQLEDAQPRSPLLVSLPGPDVSGSRSGVLYGVEAHRAKAMVFARDLPQRC
jgi:hypothetical protein